jgi:hypothetical protein
MKVVNSCLFVNVQNEIVCGDGSFKATIEHQIIVGDEGVDVEFLDITNIKFMGLPIDGYKEYQKFKEKMSEMGIDIEKMIDDACEGLITESIIQSCKDRWEKSKI